MRLVAVSIVKNEADIIEPFVRHTLARVDHHFVFDHDSTDGTRQILHALQAEGLALTLFTDDALGNLQQIRSNYLTKLAADTQQADWIFPLDADEILIGPNRADLEIILSGLASDRPASLPLLNYCPTEADDPTQKNPVLRLRYCQSQASRTKKIIIPRALALNPAVSAGKGSHALYRENQALPDQPLPEAFHLAHLALRSPQHQILRVVLAELQKLSRGRSHAGLDEHYRLGFQLLAEDPALFFATIYQPIHTLRLRPIVYQGTPPRYDQLAQGWGRLARALLPFLDKLATSHGRLLDLSADAKNESADDAPVISELPAKDVPFQHFDDSKEAFTGFDPLDGWGPLEGPVPEAFLPPFHWGYAPATQLSISANQAQSMQLIADALTYSANQTVRIELNGTPVCSHSFGRINQKERLTALLNLRAGSNQLTFHYTQALITPQDPRQLAVIFLGLRLLAPIA